MLDVEVEFQQLIGGADAARIEGYNVLFRGLVMFKQRGGKGESRNSFQRCTDNTEQDA